MKALYRLALLLAVVAPRALAGTTIGGRDGEVRGVSVLPATGKVEIVIDLLGAAVVQDFTLSNPARLVIDLQGTRLTGPVALYDGKNRGGVRNIRYAQFKPDVVRVVIDLDALKDYQVERAAGQVRVRIGSDRTGFAAWSSSTVTPAAPVAVATRAPAPAAAPAVQAKVTGDVPPRLRDRFRATVIPALMKERGYTNPFQVPRMEKIVINMGVGEGKENAKVVDFAVADLQTIAGQKPVVTRAKKSIANFKLRENSPIGCKVTLRGARMYEFLDRLVNVALPRVRDFRGVPPKSFDGRGNYALGLKEQVIFPEIVYDKVDKTRGMDIIMVTTADTDEEAKALLSHLGLPFRES